MHTSRTNPLVTLARLGLRMCGVDTPIILRTGNDIVMGITAFVVMGGCFLTLALMGSILVGAVTLAMLGMVGMVEGNPSADDSLILGIILVAAFFGLRKVLARIKVA